MKCQRCGMQTNNTKTKLCVICSLDDKLIEQMKNDRREMIADMAKIKNQKNFKNNGNNNKSPVANKKKYRQCKYPGCTKYAKISSYCIAHYRLQKAQEINFKSFLIKLGNMSNNEQLEINVYNQKNNKLIATILLNNKILEKQEDTCYDGIKNKKQTNVKLR